MEAATQTQQWAEQGAKLKRARKRLGQREGEKLGVNRFANRIGVTPRHLFKIESGRHRPGLPILRAIARETGETVESFGYPDDLVREETRA